MNAVGSSNQASYPSIGIFNYSDMLLEYWAWLPIILEMYRTSRFFPAMSRTPGFLNLPQHASWHHDYLISFVMSNPHNQTVTACTRSIWLPKVTLLPTQWLSTRAPALTDTHSDYANNATQRDCCPPCELLVGRTLTRMHRRTRVPVLKSHSPKP